MSTNSRFVSEASLQEAQARRKEEWQKAYERLGQKAPENEGPPQVYDPRSLYEKLQEQKDNKQAAFDEKYSIRNQFRSLEEDEISFLDSVLDDKKVIELERQKEVEAELAKFRQAVTAKSTLPDNQSTGSPPLAGSSGSPLGPSVSGTSGEASPPAAGPSISKPLPPPPQKKKSSFQQKGLLAGAIKRKSSGGEKDKKKPSPASVATAKDASPGATKQDEESKVEQAAKKRKVEETPTGQSNAEEA